MSCQDVTWRTFTWVFGCGGMETGSVPSIFWLNSSKILCPTPPTHLSQHGGAQTNPKRWLLLVFDIQIDGIGEEWNVFRVNGWREWRESFKKHALSRSHPPFNFQRVSFNEMSTLCLIINQENERTVASVGNFIPFKAIINGSVLLMILALLSSFQFKKTLSEKNTAQFWLHIFSEALHRKLTKRSAYISNIMLHGPPAVQPVAVISVFFSGMWYQKLLRWQLRGFTLRGVIKKPNP